MSNTAQTSSLYNARILIVFSFCSLALVLLALDSLGIVHFVCLRLHFKNSDYTCCCFKSLLNKSQTSRYPLGYFDFVGVSVVSLAASLFTTLLSLTGFGLYEAFLEQLVCHNGNDSLSSSTRCSRIHSYWLFVAGLALNCLYFVFKFLALCHLVKLTMSLISIKNTFTLGHNRESLRAKKQQPSPFTKSKRSKMYLQNAYNYKSVNYDTVISSLSFYSLLTKI